MINLFATVALLACMAASHAVADETDRDVREMKLFRFEFDNDTFLDSDDAFSAGWSFQVHSEMLDEWTPGFSGWVGRFPTLGDDGEGGRIVRWSWGITQLIITPTDVMIAAAQPGDAPWAGLLGGHASWSAYDAKRLAALQVYLGCVGPCSAAEQTQKFVHDDLGFGEMPEGWPNQLEDDVLFNLNYEYRHKVWTGGAHYETSGWGHDLAVGTQVGLGSFATYAGVWIEYRFGWDIPQGFSELADPPALGVTLDPVYSDPSRTSAVRRTWKPYFTLVARRREVEKFVATEGGMTENGEFYHPVVSTPGDEQVIFGVHVAKIPLAFHLTYYRYLDDGAIAAVPSELDWVNFSFERRF